MTDDIFSIPYAESRAATNFENAIVTKLQDYKKNVDEQRIVTKQLLNKFKNILLYPMLHSYYLFAFTSSIYSLASILTGAIVLNELKFTALDLYEVSAISLIGSVIVSQLACNINKSLYKKYRQSNRMYKFDLIKNCVNPMLQTAIESSIGFNIINLAYKTKTNFKDCIKSSYLGIFIFFIPSNVWHNSVLLIIKALKIRNDDRIIDMPNIIEPSEIAEIFHTAETKTDDPIEISSSNIEISNTK